MKGSIIAVMVLVIFGLAAALPLYADEKAPDVAEVDGAILEAKTMLGDFEAAGNNATDEADARRVEKTVQKAGASIEKAEGLKERGDLEGALEEALEAMRTIRKGLEKLNR